FALVEERGALEPLLERQRRVVRGWPAAGALGPAFARLPAAAGGDAVVTRSSAPGKCRGRRRNDRRLLLGARRDSGFRLGRIILPRLFVLAATLAAAHGKRRAAEDEDSQGS